MSKFKTKSIVIPPFYYIHVKDENSHTYRLEHGPQLFVRKDHESVTTGDRPVQMTTLPIRHYCVIEDPVIRDEASELVLDDNG